MLDWDATSSLAFEFGVTAWKDESDVQAPQARELAFQTVNPAAANPVAIEALTDYPLAPDDPRAADWDPGRDFSQDNRFVQGTLRADWSLTDSVTMTSLTAYSEYDTFSITRRRHRLHVTAPVRRAPYVSVTELAFTNTQTRHRPDARFELPPIEANGDQFT